METVRAIESLAIDLALSGAVRFIPWATSNVHGPVGHGLTKDSLIVIRTDERTERGGDGTAVGLYVAGDEL